LALRSGTGAILLLLGRLSALLPLGRALARRLTALACGLALCAGTASILLLRLGAGRFLLRALGPARLVAAALALAYGLTFGLIFLGLATPGLIPIALVFRLARLIAAGLVTATLTLADGLTLRGLLSLSLALLRLTAIHHSIALALGPTAFSHSLSPGFALHAFATLSAP